MSLRLDRMSLSSSHQAGDDCSTLFSRGHVEIAQAPEAIHHPFLMGRLPAWVNTELGHPRGIEAGGGRDLEFRAAQRLAELAHLRGFEVARRAVTGKALAISEFNAAQHGLAQQC